jgi:hypothetical protein
MLNLRTFVGIAAALLPAISFHASAQEIDRWYEIWISGARSGWSHETVTTEGDLVTTASEMRLTIGRADQNVEIATETWFVETEGGKPIEMRVRQQFGPVPVATAYEFRESDVLVRSSQGETERQTTMPLPEGEWLTPRAATDYLEQRLTSGATEITIRTLDPSNGLAVVTTTRREITPAEVEGPEGKVKGYTAKSRTKVGPNDIPSTEWFDAEGTLLRNETSLGGMQMTMVASTRGDAMLAADPAELMISTFVKPSRPISGARTRKAATYRVSISEGALPAIPASAFQRAETIDDHIALVRVNTQIREPAVDVDREAHLAATTYLDKDHELIRELTARAVKGIPADDREAQAEALRRFVHRHIKSKDLGVAFATATETARSCEGDCSEHGVLLAAMLRAAGIPSRVVAGVVYVDEFAGEKGVFGYHMWTQALLESGQDHAWVDLDPTLGRETPFDATHIAFATSRLDEGEAMGSLSAIAPLLGTLEIKVEEIE